ncbi:MAG: tRNA uridine-5-carboxymethylaminomethyl(34) synthesis GTPase MnmE [Oscillospiraceae bacterium]|nr:tRNA uridine-5-carboxymethylaminomethyl(34) synthesis GTPase MnmE [Oscillospiraceae bacterium]
MTENRETVAALSTPRGSGGISVIRISGSDALKIADKLFVPLSADKLPSRMEGYTCALGKLCEGGRVIDDVVLTVFRAPHSYTGEDTVEISCHGGMFVADEILRAVFGTGAKPADGGEFTRRAFENGKMSLTQAEAVMDVITSRNEASLRGARALMEGELYRKAAAQRERLTSLLSSLGAWIDYPDEDLPETDTGNMKAELEDISRELKKLMSGHRRSVLVKEGIRTVIAGRPNAGKSTLMNRLAGYERSIVTDVAGTTRDVVEESIRIGDLILNISDTAGIRDTAGEIEQIGIDMAKKRLDTADLCLAVFDGAEELDESDREVISLCGKSSAVKIAVINKTDKPVKTDTGLIESIFGTPVYISAAKGECDELITAIEKAFPEIAPSDELMINERQRQCLEECAKRLDEAVAAIDNTTLDAVNIILDEALFFLLELTGERVTEEVVKAIFSKFCVGK